MAMTIVITMAGLGSRFKKAGYAEPKYMIEVHGKTLFNWSMLSLRGVSANKYIFIVQAADNSQEFIGNECRILGIENYTVHEIDYLTSGQAETAILASPYWEKEEGLLIYNIDTFVEPFEIKSEDFHGDGFIPCFNGEGDHWSFVRLGDGEEAVEVREKHRVSEHCTVGAYYFKSAALYEELYQTFYLTGDRQLEAVERYVAPLYNYLIGLGGKVFISSIAYDRVHVLGTPEEVEIFKSIPHS